MKDKSLMQMLDETRTERDRLLSQNEALREALEHITKPEGAYSRDSEQYINNVLAWCIKTAQAALKLEVCKPCSEGNHQATQESVPYCAAVGCECVCAG